MIIRIAKSGKNETVLFAASELKRIMSEMDKSAEFMFLSYKEYDPELTNVIWVTDSKEIPSPEVSDPSLDDAVSISVHNSAGYISGPNPRSVLIGVYRFLTELGCAFIRPGKDGEVIPARSLSDINVEVFEKASYRHRAVCIEGAISQENVLDMIDWLPKVGMNGYFNQFHNQSSFYDRWYGHRNNPSLPVNGSCTQKDGEGIMLESISEIKKRGMLYHGAGHGWTAFPFDIPGGIITDDDIPEDKRELLALINGKRGVFNKSMGNTNLCYSNEYVRNTIAESVADYCTEIPEMDYVHFWLADYGNNHCECENCQKHIPSDFYIMMLNRIDEILTERGIDTKVVFLVYVDLLWEPLDFHLNNPDRFVLMFAPISRSYSTALAKAEKFDPEKLAPYSRNKLFISANVGWNIARLNKWQEDFKGDGFDFDYHFMWDHHKDPGYYKTAELLFDDMKNLDKIGLNGMVSCQNQRVFFPTGLGMIAMAKALWDKELSFEDVATKYFADAFGPDGKLVKEYMATLSELFDPTYLRGEKIVVSKEAADKFDKIPSIIDDFSNTVRKNVSAEGSQRLEGAQLKQWQNLEYYAELYKLVAKTFSFYAKGNFESGEMMKATAKAYAQLNELALQEVFDVCYFIVTIDRITKDLTAAANNQKNDIQFE